MNAKSIGELIVALHVNDSLGDEPFAQTGGNIGLIDGRVPIRLTQTPTKSSVETKLGKLALSRRTPENTASFQGVVGNLCGTHPFDSSHKIWWVSASTG